MEKRLVLAIALSLLVLLSWSAWAPQRYHTENKGVTEKADIPPKSVAPEISSSPGKQAKASLPQFQYKLNQLEVTFIEPWAAIKEVKFRAYQDHQFTLKNGFFLADTALQFTKESSTDTSVTFVHSDQHKKIIKKFIFSNSSYSIMLELQVHNLSSVPLTLNLPLVLGILDFSSGNAQSRFEDVAVATKEKTLHLNGRKSTEFAQVKFLSLRDRYFCAIMSATDNDAGFIKSINPRESEIGLVLPNLVIPPSQQIEKRFHIYLGPQELRLINAINPEWSAVLYYGTFDFIAQILLQLLEFLYRLVHNWGWAIVIFSLVVYLVLYPLTLKQMRSMKEMQILQPQVEELRKLYKDNPQKLNKEIMELYRQHKVNPFGGCLPLVLQMPIFFALYQVLMRSVALKGTSFLWIKDLSEPDKLFPLPFPKPFDAFNLLPILMMLGMFVQQKITTTSTASTGTAEQQKMMMIAMPLIFGFIFYSMPSGLVLYWFINSTLMLIYQLRIRRAK